MRALEPTEYEKDLIDKLLASVYARMDDMGDSSATKSQKATKIIYSFATGRAVDAFFVWKKQR